MDSNFTKAYLEMDVNKTLFDTIEGNVITETFLDVPNYVGIYQISNFGRIKSLKRIIERINGKPYPVKEKILNQTFDGRGYLTIKLYKGNSLKNIKTHVLMGIIFKGHIQTGTTKIVVDHKDNVKTNNYEWNLQLISHRENCVKDIKIGTSNYVGVSWSVESKKWRSSISINGKVKHLGLFKNELKASQKYQEALRKYLGTNSLS